MFIVFDLLSKCRAYFPQDSEVPGASGRFFADVYLGLYARVFVAVPTAGHVNGVVVEYVVTKQLAGAKSSEQGCLVLEVGDADIVMELGLERYVAVVVVVIVVVMVVVMVEPIGGF